MFNMEPLWSRIQLRKYHWIIYHILLVLVFLISCLFFFYGDFLHTDIDSARYLLSALVQSEAAVIALVVTLSLVAVQLVASSYSTKALEIFSESPDLWVLAISYIGTIIYSLIILKTINETNYKILEIHIIFSCSFGFFCFIALLPYIYVVLTMLKPSNIILRLSQRIDLYTFLHKDAALPLINIVIVSILKYDFDTARNGMEIIGNRISNILRNENISDEQDLEISRTLNDYVSDIGELAKNRSERGSIIALMNMVSRIGKVATEMQLDRTSSQLAVYIGTLGLDNVGQCKKEITGRAIEILGNFRSIAIDKKVHIVMNTTRVILEKIEVIARGNYHDCKPEGDTYWLEIAAEAREFFNSD